ncbi:hypothetical protein [Paenibacillus sp. Z6-24]
MAARSGRFLAGRCGKGGRGALFGNAKKPFVMAWIAALQKGLYWKTRFLLKRGNLMKQTLCIESFLPNVNIIYGSAEFKFILFIPAADTFS